MFTKKLLLSVVYAQGAKKKKNNFKAESPKGQAVPMKYPESPQKLTSYSIPVISISQTILP